VISGLIDCFATAISISLQYGVPLKALCDKFTHTRFEPSGITTNPDIRIAKSIADYIFRWLSLKFLNEERLLSHETSIEEALGRAPAENAPGKGKNAARENGLASSEQGDRGMEYRLEADAPTCPECGSLMARNASCYRCYNCGTTNGCS
jgi:ribonucleoside-diphosphate reductase alpha chain